MQDDDIEVYHLETGWVEDFRHAREDGAPRHPFYQPYTRLVRGPDWVVYEHEDGNLHVAHGLDESGNPIARDPVVVPKTKERDDAN